MKGRTLLLLSAFLLLSLGMGCGRVVSPTKDSLEVRCKAYWQLRQKGDWGTVYDYLVPEERKFVRRYEFVNDRSKQLSFLGYQIESIEVKGNEGTTNTKCKWRINIPGDELPHRDGEVTLTERWLFAGDNWYIKMLSPPQK